MYFLVKCGVYDHGVFWIGTELTEGISQADEAARQDIDSYHEWEVRNLLENKGYDADAVYDLMYAVSKGENGVFHSKEVK